MSTYRMSGQVTGAKVSDLPWPDLATHFHIEYTVAPLDDVDEVLSGARGLTYEISLAYPRKAPIETVSVEGGPVMTVPDWMCKYAVGKQVYLLLDDDDEPTDIQFIEPGWN